MRHRWLRRISWPSQWPSVLAAIVLALTIGVTPAQAHHGWSGYDSSTLLTLTGTILDVQYGNPHVMVTPRGARRAEEEHVEGEVHAEAEIEDPSSVTVVMAPPFRSESRGLSRRHAGAWRRPPRSRGTCTRPTSMELRAERITIGGLTVELR